MLPGIVGSIQAMETIKLILASGDSLVGRLLLFDALAMKFRELKLRKNPDCPMCGKNRTINKLIDYYEFCGVRGEEAPAPDLQVPEITPRELKSRLDRGDDLYILDVREPHEYQICNIHGHLIPLGELPRRVHELDSSREIVAHCRSGKRSAEADRFSAQGGIPEDSKSEGRHTGVVGRSGSERSKILMMTQTGTSKRMSVFDELMEHNKGYAQRFDLGHLQTPPVKKLVILTCMDSRMDLEQLLGLRVGDAHMIRNAGGLATDDAIRSLILSTHLLGTRGIAVIQHTQCGLMTITDEEFRWRLSSETGRDASHLQFHAFRDIDHNVMEQVLRIRKDPFLPKQIDVRGYVYDVKTGALREIEVA